MKPFCRLFFLTLLVFGSITWLPAQQGNTIDVSDPHGYTNSTNNEIVVEVTSPPNDECSGATDINALLGQALNMPQISEHFNTTNYTSMDDPTEGFECFEDDQPLSSTAWFSFVGDGHTYQIKSVECTADAYAFDLQAVLYIGSCESLAAIDCNEDEDYDANHWNFLLEVSTAVGVTYNLMVDRFEGTLSNEGNYCIEVTKLSVAGVTNIDEANLHLFPNPTTGTIQLPLLDLEWIEVFDAAGRMILRQAQPGQTLELGEQANGLYILKLYDGEQVYSAKVMKQ